ncbi:MAG: hypothetical protein JWR51_2278 [Devosia sp.]|uniref:hypothetical protein n=1 Tax=Devosia sp. TaxID=1871048 RepID=UPI0026124BAC|nr:hypothetical protein [Devosia sp.]MDB5529175.1 hypothetical protein [Devosia sp.]
MTQIMIATRKPQPFAAIVLTLRQPEISQKAPPLIGDVIAWVNAHGGETVGRHADRHGDGRRRHSEDRHLARGALCQPSA